MERRKYPRFELSLKAKYKIVDSGKDFEAGKTRNISAEGLCFESCEELATGTRVNLEVDLGDEKSPVCFVGEVKWSSEFKAPKSKERHFINGVRLIELPESDEGRFLKYYCDKMVEKLTTYLKM